MEVGGSRSTELVWTNFPVERSGVTGLNNKDSDSESDRQRAVGVGGYEGGRTGRGRRVSL